MLLLSCALLQQPNQLALTSLSDVTNTVAHTHVQRVLQRHSLHRVATEVTSGEPLNVRRHEQKVVRERRRHTQVERTPFAFQLGVFPVFVLNRTENRDARVTHTHTHVRVSRGGCEKPRQKFV